MSGSKPREIILNRSTNKWMLQYSPIKSGSQTHLNNIKNKIPETSIKIKSSHSSQEQCDKLQMYMRKHAKKRNHKLYHDIHTNLVHDFHNNLKRLHHKQELKGKPNDISKTQQTCYSLKHDGSKFMSKQNSTTFTERYMAGDNDSINTFLKPKNNKSVKIKDMIFDTAKQNSDWGRKHRSKSIRNKLSSSRSIFIKKQVCQHKILMNDKNKQVLNNILSRTVIKNNPSKKHKLETPLKQTLSLKKPLFDDFIRCFNRNPVVTGKTLTFPRTGKTNKSGDHLYKDNNCYPEINEQNVVKENRQYSKKCEVPKQHKRSLIFKSEIQDNHYSYPGSWQRTGLTQFLPPTNIEENNENQKESSSFLSNEEFVSNENALSTKCGQQRKSLKKLICQLWHDYSTTNISNIIHSNRTLKIFSSSCSKRKETYRCKKMHSKNVNNSFNNIGMSRMKATLLNTEQDELKLDDITKLRKMYGCINAFEDKDNISKSGSKKIKRINKNKNQLCDEELLNKTKVKLINREGTQMKQKRQVNIFPERYDNNNVGGRCYKIKMKNKGKRHLGSTFSKSSISNQICQKRKTKIDGHVLSHNKYHGNHKIRSQTKKKIRMKADNNIPVQQYHELNNSLRLEKRENCNKNNNLRCFSVTVITSEDEVIRTISYEKGILQTTLGEMSHSKCSCEKISHALNKSQCSQIESLKEIVHDRKHNSYNNECRSNSKIRPQLEIDIHTKAGDYISNHLCHKFHDKVTVTGNSYDEDQYSRYFGVSANDKIDRTRSNNQNMKHKYYVGDNNMKCSKKGNHQSKNINPSNSQDDSSNLLFSNGIKRLNAIYDKQKPPKIYNVSSVIQLKETNITESKTSKPKNCHCPSLLVKLIKHKLQSAKCNKVENDSEDRFVEGKYNNKKSSHGDKRSKNETCTIRVIDKQPSALEKSKFITHKNVNDRKFKINKRKKKAVEQYDTKFNIECDSEDKEHMESALNLGMEPEDTINVPSAFSSKSNNCQLMLDLDFLNNKHIKKKIKALCLKQNDLENSLQDFDNDLVRKKLEWYKKLKKDLQVELDKRSKNKQYLIGVNNFATRRSNLRKLIKIPFLNDIMNKDNNKIANKELEQTLKDSLTNVTTSGLMPPLVKVYDYSKGQPFNEKQPNQRFKEQKTESYETANENYKNSIQLDIKNDSVKIECQCAQLNIDQSMQTIYCECQKSNSQHLKTKHSKALIECACVQKARTYNKEEIGLKYSQPNLEIIHHNFELSRSMLSSGTRKEENKNQKSNYENQEPNTSYGNIKGKNREDKMEDKNNKPNAARDIQSEVKNDNVKVECQCLQQSKVDKSKQRIFCECRQSKGKKLKEKSSKAVIECACVQKARTNNKEEIGLKYSQPDSEIIHHNFELSRSMLSSGTRKEENKNQKSNYENQEPNKSYGNIKGRNREDKMEDKNNKPNAASDIQSEVKNDNVKVECQCVQRSKVDKSKQRIFCECQQSKGKKLKEKSSKAVIECACVQKARINNKHDIELKKSQLKSEIIQNDFEMSLLKLSSGTIKEENMDQKSEYENQESDKKYSNIKGKNREVRMKEKSNKLNAARVIQSAIKNENVKVECQCDLSQVNKNTQRIYCECEQSKGKHFKQKSFKAIIARACVPKARINNKHQIEPKYLQSNSEKKEVINEQHLNRKDDKDKCGKKNGWLKRKCKSKKHSKEQNECTPFQIKDVSENYDSLQAEQKNNFCKKQENGVWQLKEKKWYSKLASLGIGKNKRGKIEHEHPLSKVESIPENVKCECAQPKQDNNCCKQRANIKCQLKEKQCISEQLLVNGKDKKHKIEGACTIYQKRNVLENFNCECEQPRSNCFCLKKEKKPFPKQLLFRNSKTKKHKTKCTLCRRVNVMENLECKYSKPKLENNYYKKRNNCLCEVKEKKFLPKQLLLENGKNKKRDYERQRPQCQGQNNQPNLECGCMQFNRKTTHCKQRNNCLCQLKRSICSTKQYLLVKSKIKKRKIESDCSPWQRKNIHGIMKCEYEQPKYKNNSCKQRSNSPIVKTKKYFPKQSIFVRRKRFSTKHSSRPRKRSKHKKRKAQKKPVTIRPITDRITNAYNVINSKKFCKDLYIHTLHKRPCFIVYRLCPGSYHIFLQCLYSIKQALHICAYGIVFAFWLPCILTTSLCLFCKRC